MKIFTNSLLSLVALPITVASSTTKKAAYRKLQDVTVDSFCSDFSSLTAHMKTEFEAFFEVSLTNEYQCECDGTSSSDTIIVDCSTTYNVDGSTGSNFERSVFTKTDDGSAFALTMTSWGDTLYGPMGSFQETYVVDGGRLASCTANGCTSCTICPFPSTAVATDCSTLPNDLDYVSQCTDTVPSEGTFLFTYGVTELKLPPEEPMEGSAATTPANAVFNTAPFAFAVVLTTIFAL